MKKIRKKINRQNILKLIDKILEHNYFKMVSISIITSFVLFNSISYFNNILLERKEVKHKEKIKINIGNFKERLDQIEDQRLIHVVKSGQTLSQILFELGSNEYDVNNILNSTKNIIDPRKIAQGQKIIIHYKTIIDYENEDSNKNLVRKSVISKVSLSPDPEIEMLVVRNKNGNYESSKKKKELFKKIARYAGIIKNSLFVDGTDLGISAGTMIEMINLYGFNVDFQRDLRSGDEFEILFEDYYDKNGEKIKSGDILFAALNLKGIDRKLSSYLYEYKKQPEYFNNKGRSIRRSLLTTPVNGARISSGFGYRRHPILGYRKKHRGLDFAAPRGTPVLAAGKGTIVDIGRRGAYGNFVLIKHNATYATAYAHLHRFARGMRKGRYVSQGQVIAYVGSTGRSTGPHLHYEVRKKGVRINPRKFKGTANVVLRGSSLRKFKERKNKIDKLRETTETKTNI